MENPQTFKLTILSCRKYKSFKFCIKIPGLELCHQPHVGEMLIAVYLGQRSVCVILLVVTEASDQVGEHNLQISLVIKVLLSVSAFEFLQNPRPIWEIKEKVQVVVVTEIVAPQSSVLDMLCAVIYL